jgi:hypothetical protein
MTDKVFLSNKDIEKKIKIVIVQTDYTIELAREYLEKYNYNEILVIKNYFGIAEKKTQPINSLNQEIYKQIRYKLDTATKDYNTRKNNDNL